MMWGILTQVVDVVMLATVIPLVAVLGQLIYMWEIDNER